MVNEKEIRSANPIAETDWWVYSTAAGAILVENRQTSQRASVTDFSRAEWSKAFHSPSRPYRWYATDRLIIDPST